MQNKNPPIIQLLREFSDALSSFALMIVSDSVTHLPKNLQFLTFYSSPTVPLGFFPGGINCLVTKVDWAGSVKQFLEMASAHSLQFKTKPNHHGHLSQSVNPVLDWSCIICKDNFQISLVVHLLRAFQSC